MASVATQCLGSSISEFKVSPEKTEYAPNEEVVFSGRLRGRAWYLVTWVDMVDEPIVLVCGTTPVGETRTGGDGRFSIAYRLPAEPGYYSFYARFPGRTCRDAAVSSPITLKVRAEFVCPYCGAAFRTKEDLESHIKTEHTCPYCGRVFRTRQELEQHMMVCPSKPPPTPPAPPPAPPAPLGIPLIGWALIGGVTVSGALLITRAMRR